MADPMSDVFANLRAVFHAVDRAPYRYEPMVGTPRQIAAARVFLAQSDRRGEWSVRWPDGNGVQRERRSTLTGVHPLARGLAALCGWAEVWRDGWQVATYSESVPRALARASPQT